NRKKEKRGRRSPCEPRPRSETCVFGGGAAGRDFGGRRFRSTPLSCKRQGWDLVKRCDRPGKVLIQLKRLILAQSERWRQASNIELQRTSLKSASPIARRCCRAGVSSFEGTVSKSSGPEGLA